MLRRLAVGAGVVVGLGVIAWMFLSMYAPTSHYYERFLTPARNFLRAGLTGDSLELGRLDVAPAAVQWIRETRRSSPEWLRRLEAGLEVDGGQENGDNNLVWFRADSLTGCGSWALLLRFSGPAPAMRIEEVTKSCRP